MSWLVLLLALTVPDPRLTPGALCSPTSRGFDGMKYPEQVAHCRRLLSDSTKKKVLIRYGIAWQQRGLYEVDHFIPLCLGGSNDLANLWAEPWQHARRKDALEKRLCSQLSAGKITQSEAVRQVREFK